MQISYNRTFNQFIDTYLAVYYSGSLRLLRRVLGGPFLIFIALVWIRFSRNIDGNFLRGFFASLGVLILLYGIYYFLMPLINILLVWLRQDEILGEAGAEITLTLVSEEEKIMVTEPAGSFEISFDDILYIQHRSDSAWIMTQRDQIIYIPRQNLNSGDHDKFINTIEKLLDDKEQKH